MTCGHTHLPLVAEHDGVLYINSGTWIEAPPCPFVVVQGNQVRLEHWPLPQLAAGEEPVEAAYCRVRGRPAGAARPELRLVPALSATRTRTSSHGIPGPQTCRRPCFLKSTYRPRDAPGPCRIVSESACFW